MKYLLIVFTPRITILACLLFIFSSTILQASTIRRLEAIGTAVIIDNNTIQAHFEAYQDALRNIALQAGSQVHSSTSYNSNEGISDSIQIRSTQNIQSSKVISETVNDGILTLTVAATLNDDNKLTQGCDFPASQYRKKIAALFFPLQHPEHLNVVDYYGFEQGIGQALLQQLALNGNFLTKDATQINAFTDLNSAPYIQATNSSDGRSLLNSIKEEFGVQYVVSGVIRDLSTTTIKNSLTLPFGISLSRDQFVSLNPQPAKPNQRNLVIDIYIHDTLTEELLSKHRYSYSIDKTTVLPNKATAFNTKAFKKSDFGQLFDKVIQQETQLISSLLACRPFTMKILQQKDHYIYLNAGQNTNIKVGDIVTMHYADIEGKSFDTNSQAKQFGWPKQQLKIIKVFPSYSIATSTSKQVIHLKKNSDYILVW